MTMLCKEQKQVGNGTVMKQRDEAVNILYASNDGYAGHLAASLYSLLDNNRQIRELTVYLLSAGMCRRYQKRLSALAESFGRRLYVTELGDLRARFPYEVDTRGFDISAMARLFAPEALPEDVRRILYLDCDTIVCGPVGELYRTPLRGGLAGMVMEPTVYAPMKEAIGMAAEEAYFNSGVILMDLEAWRRERILERLLVFYGEHSGSLFACDQDTLNGVLRGRIRPLSPRYNFFTNYRYFHYRTLCRLCPAYRQVGRREFVRARRAPVIIHYLGDERPWIAGNHNHYRKHYRRYLARTPWRDQPLQEGRRLYMQLWWVFNHVSWLCPPLRLWISRSMGMRLIDSRRKGKE